MPGEICRASPSGRAAAAAAPRNRQRAHWHGSCVSGGEAAGEHDVPVRRHEHGHQRPQRAIQRVREHQRQRIEQPDGRLQAHRYELHRLSHHQHRRGERIGLRGRAAGLRQHGAGHDFADRRPARPGDRRPGLLRGEPPERPGQQPADLQRPAILHPRGRLEDGQDWLPREQRGGLPERLDGEPARRHGEPQRAGADPGEPDRVQPGRHLAGDALGQPARDPRGRDADLLADPGLRRARHGAHRLARLDAERERRLDGLGQRAGRQHPGARHRRGDVRRGEHQPGA